MTGRHRPPSQVRYAESHPSVTVHFDRETYTKLVELRERTGLTMNQLVRRNLGSEEREVDAILARGRRLGVVQGRKAGRDAGLTEGYASGHTAGVAAGYESGRRDGAREAIAQYRLTYPCSVCRQPIEVLVNGPEAPHLAAALSKWGAPPLRLKATVPPPIMT
jgi:hypothetical protein